MTRVVLLPPDERPVSTRLPRMIGACGGVDVVVPPPGLLPSFRIPADPDALAAWLMDEAAEADAIVVSLDLLAHGGLVPSRLSGDAGTDVVSRLAILREIPARADVPVYASMVVTRVPDADDATEEPEYWAHHGRDIHALSAALSERTHDAADGAEVDTSMRRVPAEVRSDWLGRRLRNHMANLAALHLAADGSVDALALTADDTATRGLPALERGWLEGWTSRLGLTERVFHYPGADEVPGILIARVLLRDHDVAVAVHAADAAGMAKVAPYEDQPIARTAQTQVRASGARLVDDTALADVVLVVHPPSDRPGDWALAPPERGGATPARIARLADDVARFIEAGRRVAVADCAWPNGGDPALVAMLDERGLLPRLAGYAGWNTAGNSIGSALAPALARIGSGEDEDGACERLLVHRLVEDVGYQAELRQRVRTIVAEHPEAAPAAIEDGLTHALRKLRGLGERWRLRPGSVRLPWNRAFEVDFDLERVTT